MSLGMKRCRHRCYSAPCTVRWLHYRSTGDSPVCWGCGALWRSTPAGQLVRIHLAWADIVETAKDNFQIHRKRVTFDWLEKRLARLDAELERLIANNPVWKDLSGALATSGPRLIV